MNFDREIRDFLNRLSRGLSLEEYANRLEVLIEEANAELDAALDALEAQGEDE